MNIVVHKAFRFVDTAGAAPLPGGWRAGAVEIVARVPGSSQAEDESVAVVAPW